MNDRAIQAKVHSSIVASLLRYLPETVARNIVRAIAKGEVPAVSISYGGAK